jgi:hypothetical protein
MRLLAISFLTLLSACAPESTGPYPDVASEASRSYLEPQRPSAEERAACESRRGEMRREGMLGSYQCVIPFTDAARRCTDGDQCLGDCRVSPNVASPPPGQSVVGQCQIDSSPFGCNTSIEDGKAQPTLCVD